MQKGCNSSTHSDWLREIVLHLATLPPAWPPYLRWCFGSACTTETCTVLMHHQRQQICSWRSTNEGLSLAFLKCPRFPRSSWFPLDSTERTTDYFSFNSYLLLTAFIMQKQNANEIKAGRKSLKKTLLDVSDQTVPEEDFNQNIGWRSPKKQSPYVKLLGGSFSSSSGTVVSFAAVQSRSFYSCSVQCHKECRATACMCLYSVTTVAYDYPACPL